jgi:uncharacterized protein (TIGR02246 family)
MRLLLALGELAIGFAVSALAQHEDTADTQVAQQRNLLGDVKAIGEFSALSMKEEEAFNRNDAGAVAALFTEDAVLVAPEGLFFGRQAIEKRYADMFQRWPMTNFSGQRDELNAIDHAVWSVGHWWSNLRSRNGPIILRGYWSAIYVREGDAWKIRMLTVNEKKPDFLNDLQQTPRLVPPAETK